MGGTWSLHRAPTGWAGPRGLLVPILQRQLLGLGEAACGVQPLVTELGLKRDPPGTQVPSSLLFVFRGPGGQPCPYMVFPAALGGIV